MTSTIQIFWIFSDILRIFTKNLDFDYRPQAPAWPSTPKNAQKNKKKELYC